MYWLALVLSVAGSPDMHMEMHMGSYFTCSLAKQKFEDSNPPSIYVEGKQKKSSFSDIKCVKKG
tara:strand:- start:458 stop:649 length:192 start_codon:yes stop_codon:yes gene_type:complete